MTYQDVSRLWNMGVFLATTHDLPAEDAIKVINFKVALRDAVESLYQRMEQIKGDPREAELTALLLSEQAEVKADPIPFASFHALARENRAISVELEDENGGKHQATFDPFTAGEMALRGILWE